MVAKSKLTSPAAGAVKLTVKLNVVPPALPSAMLTSSMFRVTPPPAPPICPVLQAPGVSGIGPVQVKSPYALPVPVNCNELPIGSPPGSKTPMSVLINPSAGPPTAVKLPS